MNRLKIAFFATIVAAAANAQKIGVVDTNYILARMPQYKEAEARLNSQVKQWEEEVQRLQTEYETKRNTFENEKILLVGDQLKQREQEIKDLDAKLKNTVSQRFGTDGEMNRSRSALVKPFQDQIWNAIKTMSEKNNLGIVLDKSNNISVIFLDKKYDYTDKVLDLLLQKNNAAGAEPKKTGNNKRN
ncbi:periplasmic chaperone for outer membrane proteins Skp [Cruoricaptor ignavus]|uniref:Periplasmic chaperone for outer membrane proteins Skp n=1 Tax=Cruoricaptor ignavus TaxID=1118202 RepID=A0A1M6CUS9_9FLAO|nr:OmpH family outer membrane protein [Cruoricaptor ignavus]SHI64845.1 periplasmic chaperone for outer membrane proteins Skp [Cruoricaptor ignavus]